MTTNPGAIGARTTGVSRGGTKKAAGDSARTALPPPVIDVDETTTTRKIVLGGKEYIWPSRVAIVGYGVKKGVPARVEKLMEQLRLHSDESQLRWEVRLNESMKTKTL